MQKISLLCWDNLLIKHKPICLKHLLAKQLNPQHPRYLLAHAIPWKKLEESFAPLYARVGLPSHPIRKMATLLMRKHRYNLSDERVETFAWRRII